MENNNPVSSKLVFYIWMLHTLKNIRQNSIFYDSKSATHETFVTGKVTFRICHDEFVMSPARSNCGYSFKMPLSFVSDNYYTEAAKIIKEPPAALPKREFHVHRHSQACLRSTSTSSAAEFIYHREQYPEFPEFWWQIACWVSLQNENTIETQSTVNGLLFVMPKRKKEKVSRRADDSIYIFIYIEAQPMDSKSEQS